MILVQMLDIRRMHRTPATAFFRTELLNWATDTAPDTPGPLLVMRGAVALLFLRQLLRLSNTSPDVLAESVKLVDKSHHSQPPLACIVPFPQQRLKTGSGTAV